MRRRILLLPLLLAAGLSGQTLQQMQVPQIPFVEFKLSNGLRVILSQDYSLPLVTESMLFASPPLPPQAAARTAARLMFAGSAHAPGSAFTRLLAAYGGTGGVTVRPGYTYFHETVPSNALEAVMWLDADRLASLAPPSPPGQQQIQLYAQEARLRVANTPYGPLLHGAVQQQAWGWPVAPATPDLGAARTWAHEYFTPRNCILTIVGAFEAAQVKPLVQKYFGWIPSGGPLPPLPAAAPAQSRPASAPRSETLRDPMAHLPALSIAWQGPPRGSRDYYALAMLSRLLFAGHGAALYQSLVADHQVALTVTGGLGYPFDSYRGYQSPGLFGAFVIFKPGTAPALIQGLVMQQIHQLEATGVSQTALRRWQAMLESEWIASGQTTLGRNRMLALSALLDGKPGAVNAEIGHFLNVTSDDLEHAAQTYLIGARANVIVDVPAPPAPATPGGH